CTADVDGTGKLPESFQGQITTNCTDANGNPASWSTPVAVGDRMTNVVNFTASAAVRLPAATSFSLSFVTKVEALSSDDTTDQIETAAQVSVGKCGNTCSSGVNAGKNCTTNADCPGSTCLNGLTASGAGTGSVPVQTCEATLD